MSKTSLTATTNPYTGACQRNYAPCDPFSELRRRVYSRWGRGEGSALQPSARPPGPQLPGATGLEPARIPWRHPHPDWPLHPSRDAGLLPARRLPGSRRHLRGCSVKLLVTLGFMGYSRRTSRLCARRPGHEHLYALPKLVDRRSLAEPGPKRPAPSWTGCRLQRSSAPSRE